MINIFMIAGIGCVILAGIYVVKRLKGLHDEQQEKKKR